MGDVISAPYFLASTPTLQWPLWRQYTLAIGMTLAAVGVRWLLHPILGDEVPFILAFSVLLLLILLVRVGPFFFAGILGWLLLAPAQTWLAGALFGVAVLGATWVCGTVQARYKQSVRALLEKEERYRAIVESQAEMVCRFRMDGTILFVNGAYARARGAAPDELLGKNFWNWIAEADRPGVKSLLEQLHPARPTIRIENRFETGEGVKWTLWTNAGLVFDSAGRATEVQSTGIDITDRKRAEEALRLSEERYRTLFNAIDEGFCIVQLEYENGKAGGFTFLEVNPAFEKLTGIKAVPGRQVRTGAPDIDADWIQTFGRVAETGEPAFFQKEASVLERWYDVYAFRVGDPELQRVAVRFNDITESKVAQDRLRAKQLRLEEMVRSLAQSEERYRILSDIIPYGTWMLDRSGDIVHISSSFLEMLGQSLEEYVRNWSARIHPDDRARLLEKFPRQIAIQQQWEEEFRVCGKDGRYRWILSRGLPLHDTAGELLGWVGINLDLTAHREAEEQARRLATIIEGTPDFVAMGRLDGRLVYINRSGRLLLGLGSTDDPATLRQRDLVPQWVKRRMEEEWVPAAIRGGTAAGEGAVLTRDGKEIPVSFVLLVHRNARGEPEYVSAIARNILAEKQAQQALRDADRRKDEFLAILGHELRNPLAAMDMAFSVLKASREEKQKASAIAIVERQCAQLVRLVDELLDVSRITRGQIELQRQSLDVIGAVSSAVELMRATCERNELTLHLKLPAQPIYVDADPVRLAQIVSNLVGNACKFTPSGGQISVSVDETDDAAVIRVADSGVGITAEQLPQLFRMFAQIDPHRDYSKGGLGIGLALARRLAELHGGTVKAHSDGPGKGSEFTVLLPKMRETRRVAQTLTEDAAAAFAAESKVAKRILAVDDNNDALATLRTLLSLKGHVVFAASSGPEALEQAARHQPDIVLLDIGLPGMDGYEVARRIRQQSWGQEMLLIAITGWGQEEDKKKTTAAGFNAHLTKPADLRALERLLQQKGGALNTAGGHSTASGLRAQS